MEHLNISSSEMSYELILEKWTRFLDRFEVKSEGSFIIYPIVMSVFFVTSLIGNLLTCTVIYIDKSMHTTTNYYLFNLAVSDLLLTISLALEIVQHVIVPYAYTNVWSCQVQWFFVLTLWNCSMMTLTALAIERYIAVWYPLWLDSTQTLRRVLKNVVLIWIIATIETIPELMTVTLIKTSHSVVCITVPTRYGRIVNALLLFTGIILPLTIITFVYSAILIKVNSRSKRELRNKICNNRNSRGKVNMVVVAITVTFVICWLPFLIVRIVFSVLDIHQLLELPKWWSFVFQFVIVDSWVSVIMNPLLYSLISLKFRRSLKFLCLTKLRRTSKRDYIQERGVPMI